MAADFHLEPFQQNGVRLEFIHFRRLLIVLLAYFASPARIKNATLLAASLVFYAARQTGRQRQLNPFIYFRFISSGKLPSTVLRNTTIPPD